MWAMSRKRVIDSKPLIGDRENCSPSGGRGQASFSSQWERQHAPGKARNQKRSVLVPWLRYGLSVSSTDPSAENVGSLKGGA
jgi:hypothetical protein